MTFLEAYKKTGRVFCITLSSTTKKAPPLLLNHLTAPDVVIASAVVASAAVPGCVPPVHLLYKQPDGTLRGSQTRGKEEAYFDGSIRQDIPVNGLAEMLNCQFFIACQCNVRLLCLCVCMFNVATRVCVLCVSIITFVSVTYTHSFFGVSFLRYSHTLYHSFSATRATLVVRVVGPVVRKNRVGVVGFYWEHWKCI